MTLAYRRPAVRKGADVADELLPPLERELHRALVFIRRSFHRRPRLPEIAMAAHLSPFHFHRQFKRRYGRTPHQVVSELQVGKAKTLMLRGVPLRAVATRCGFSHASHFSACFKHATGTTPKRWLLANGSTRTDREPGEI